MELLVASALVGLTIATGVNAFNSIQKAIQSSKARTLATNLAQEKIQILKQASYNRLLVTTSLGYRTDFTPNIPYDTGNYPPESILEGGLQFTRITYVQVAQENSGALQTLSPTTPDTGMKLVTVTVVWNPTGNDPRKVQVLSIDTNPNTVMSISVLTGTVRNASTSAAIQDAVVSIAENAGWRDNTSAAGVYSINLFPGSYNLLVSAEGYFPQLRPFSIAANQTQSQTFNLIPMSSGTVQGSVWFNDHLVISQVVGSSRTAGIEQEWVELYNPSSYTWTVATGVNTGAINLGYHLRGGALTTIPMTYNTFTVGPGRYFLMANRATIYACGIARAADAVYNPVGGNVILVESLDPSNDAAMVQISDASSSRIIDQVGWTRGAATPPSSEGTAIFQAAMGLEEDEQWVRRTSTAGVVSNYGRAYDTGDNLTDFMTDGRAPMIYPPRNSTDYEPPIAGVPAYGAVVSASDGLSTATTAYLTGSPPYAEFRLVSVATGTWTVWLSSSSNFLQVDSVTVTHAATTRIPNAGSSPSWPLAGYNTAILSSAAVNGFITGRIINALGATIPSITVSASGYSPITAGSNGYYTLSVVPGNYTVTANPNNTNGAYVSQDQYPTVTLGEVTSGWNFVLSQGGRIQGYTTRDVTNALSGVAVAATSSSGITYDQALSASNGLFTLVNLATGTYTVAPVLDSGETSSPTSATAVVTSGGLISVGTFTITGAYGVVTGSVTKSGNPIRTGVLVVVSTSTISTPPPLSSSTLTGISYYSNSSQEDGTYRIEVRGSTTTNYRVHGFYYNWSGQTPTLSSGAVANVSITAGQTTSGVNFSW